MRRKYVLGLAVFILGVVLTVISFIPKSQERPTYWWEEEREEYPYSYLMLPGLLFCIAGATWIVLCFRRRAPVAPTRRPIPLP